jgi:tRNA-dihydrouridine synthase B
MKIHNFNLKGKVFLAPMAGVNDLAFRIMCHNYGSALNFTEMINVNAIERKNQATLRLAHILEDERPVSLQLFGSRIEAIKKSIKILENYENVKPNMFDFNFGCPVRRIMNQGAGSALLKRPSKIGEIIRAMRDSTDLPISAKIRLGLTPKSADYLKIAKIIEQNGADMLIVHARYQSQGYSGKADWDKLKEIKENLNIPVVGNGDVVDEISAKKMLDHTGCDFIMIGRATMGNPFIFKRINSYLDNGKLLQQENKLSLFIEYLELAKKYNVKSSLIKMQAMYFTKGVSGSNILRNKISSTSGISEIYEIFKSYFDK